MLKSLAVRGFKSLVDVGPIEMAPLTVFFGPNAAGKSNLLDAIQLLSRLATRPLPEAIEGPVRGRSLELFSFPDGEGLSGLLKQDHVTLSLRADLEDSSGNSLQYDGELGIHPASGKMTLEYVSGSEAEIRNTLASFRSYYLDPRIAMRQAEPPREVDDIGPLGESLAPFLYRLKSEQPKVFHSVRRTLSTLIPSVEDLIIDLDPRRGDLNIEIRQNGTIYSSRIISEGTLRVLALICVATNPWGGSLVAFEEPENGVHPRRIELIAEMLGSLALTGSPRRQVILTTHSPLFCTSILHLARQHPTQVRMYRTIRENGATRFVAFDPAGPLLADEEIREALTAPTEDAVFEGLLLRGLFDG